MSAITKKELDHLAGLSRVSLTPAESKKYIKDLGAILDYFEQLQEINTEKIEPVMGASRRGGIKNIFRDDEVNIDKRAQSVNDAGHIIGAFPESEKGKLKVPKVFNDKI